MRKRMIYRKRACLGVLAIAMLAVAIPALGDTTVTIMDPTHYNGSFEDPVAANDFDTVTLPDWSGGIFQIRKPSYLVGATDGSQSIHLPTLSGWSSDVMTTAIPAGSTVSLSEDFGWDSWINHSTPQQSTTYVYAVNPSNTSQTQELFQFNGVANYDGFGTDAGWKTFTDSAVMPAADNGWYLQIVNASGGFANQMQDNFVLTATEPSPPPLDRGHSILLQKGLQIESDIFPRLEDTAQEVGFNLKEWKTSNFTTANLHFNTDTQNYLGTAPGIPWSEIASTYLTTQQLPYVPNLVSLQYRDEQDLTDPATLQAAVDWMQLLQTNYPDALAFTNQYGGELNATQLANYMSVAKPDMVMFDNYPFNGSTSGTNRSPTAQYQYMQEYRTAALAGNDGTGKTPIPYGLYTQMFEVNSGHVVSDSEMNLNQFSAWAFGYTFVDALVYDRPNQNSPQNGSGAVLFNGVGDSSPTPLFAKSAELNRESLNLGPALVRLISTDIRFIPGMSGSTTNPVPSGVSTWNSSAGPYITGISATNIGTVNGGKPGDVLVGYFKPLEASFEGPDFSNQVYFMIVNGLVDPTLNADCQQTIHMTFDFGTSGIDSLQRLDRDTGQVEVVPLTSDGGSLYHLDLTLDGGMGDLFKFNTGAPFVLPEPGSATLLLFVAPAFLRRKR